MTVVFCTFGSWDGLQAVSSALSNGRADDSDFMLGILNELVEQKPSFFKNSLRDLSEAMFEVANCADLGNYILPQLLLRVLVPILFLVGLSVGHFFGVGLGILSLSP